MYARKHVAAHETCKLPSPPTATFPLATCRFTILYRDNQQPEGKKKDENKVKQTHPTHEKSANSQCT